MADLVTLAEVKEYMGITGTDYDDLLESLISRMSRFVETYCQRSFAEAERTEYYDGTEYNDGTLIVNNWPISSVAELFDNPDRTFAAESEIVAADYVVYEDSGIVQILIDNTTEYLSGATMGHSSGFQVGRQSIKIKYTAGYSAANMPEDLKGAVIELVSRKFNVRGQEGIKSERLGRWSRTYGTAQQQQFGLGAVSVTASITDVLDRYKDRRMYML